jgi:RNA polymerase sigma factor (sigma-70 family)
VRFARRRGQGDNFEAGLARASDGDPEAIAQLYRDLAPLVIGYMRSNGAASPEDLASDVFVSVMDALDRFSGDREHFRSWVLTIAYRRRVDDLRRRSRRPEDAGLPDDVTELRTEAGDVESTVMARIGAGGVIEAMGELTEEQRSVVMLRVLADLPIKDICQITGKSEPAVKALLRRSFASLVRNLSEPDQAGAIVAENREIRGKIGLGRIERAPIGDS